MAGYWPDLPDRRIAYDADGTEWWTGRTINFYAFTERTAQNKIDLNDETDSNVYTLSNGADTAYHYFIFPQKRDIDGLFLAWRYNGGEAMSAPALYSSTDTTTGRDGTWTQEIASCLKAEYTQARGGQWRSSSYLNTAIAANGVKAIRIGAQPDGGLTQDSVFSTCHIYGTVTSGETPERILFLDDEHASDAEFTKPIDWGDTPRGTNRMHTIKIKNNSSTKTANTLQVTAEDLSWSMADYYDYSKDGYTWSAVEITVTSLGTSATQRVYVRQNLSNTSTMQVAAARLYCNVGSWT